MDSKKKILNHKFKKDLNYLKEGDLMIYAIPNDLNSTILQSQKENIKYIFSFINESIMVLSILIIISLIGFFYLYLKAMEIDNERLKQAFEEKKEGIFFEYSLTEKITIIGAVLLTILLFMILILSTSIKKFIIEYFDIISKIIL